MSETMMRESWMPRVCNDLDEADGLKRGGHPHTNFRENYRIRRDAIVHEDGQINQRLTIQLMTQSFFLMAAVIFLNNGATIVTKTQIGVAVVCLALSAMWVAFYLFRSVFAARFEQALLRGGNPHHETGWVKQLLLIIEAQGERNADSVKPRFAWLRSCNLLSRQRRRALYLRALLGKSSGKRFDARNYARALPISPTECGDAIGLQHEKRRICLQASGWPFQQGFSHTVAIFAVTFLAWTPILIAGIRLAVMKP